MRALTLGSGLPALLIPGSDLAHEFYAPLGEQLAQRRFRTRILTLPGFFGAPRLPSPALAPLLELLGGELSSHLEPNGVLIGHSFGGLMALCLAAAAPERVRALVLLEPAVIPSAWLARRAAKKYRRDVVQGRRDEFQNWSGSFQRVHDLSSFPSWAIEHYIAVRKATDPAVMGDWLDDLPSLYPLPFEQVSMPTLILRGESSGMWVRIGLGRIASELAQVDLQPIPGAGHWLANEQDQAIAEQIERFVSSR